MKDGHTECHRHHEQAGNTVHRAAYEPLVAGVAQTRGYDDSQDVTQNSDRYAREDDKRLLPVRPLGKISEHGRDDKKGQRHSQAIAGLRHGNLLAAHLNNVPV